MNVSKMSRQTRIISREEFIETVESVKNRNNRLEAFLVKVFSRPQIDYMRRWIFEYSTREIEEQQITDPDFQNAIYVGRRYQAMRDIAEELQQICENEPLDFSELKLNLPPMKLIDEIFYKPKD